MEFHRQILQIQHSMNIRFWFQYVEKALSAFLVALMYFFAIFLPKITHLLVDEFQDICDDECSFVLYALEAENIFLVGDT